MLSKDRKQETTKTSRILKLAALFVVLVSVSYGLMLGSVPLAGLAKAATILVFVNTILFSLAGVTFVLFLAFSGWIPPPLPNDTSADNETSRIAWQLRPPWQIAAAGLIVSLAIALLLNVLPGGSGGNVLRAVCGFWIILVFFMDVYVVLMGVLPADKMLRIARERQIRRTYRQK